LICVLVLYNVFVVSDSEKRENGIMIYKTLEEAVAAAKEMCEALETYVKITKGLKGGYELFGTGEFVMEVKE